MMEVRMLDARPVAESWASYVANRESAELHRYRLLTEYVDQLSEVLRAALLDPRQCLYALEITAQLPLERRKGLLPELLAIASHVSGDIFRARDIILAFPREWLLAEVELAVTPLLEQGDDEEYRRILELYSQIDRELMLRLATHAQNHPNPHVKEVGADFLTRSQ